MKRTCITIIAILAIFAQTLYAQETEDNSYSDADVKIKFFDRTMYYPGDAETSPVYVHVTVKNNGKKQMRFKLADDRAFSMDFDAFTAQNSVLPKTESLVKKRTTNQTVYFREISLGAGEEYSFVENVKDYLSISEPSIYYLEVDFYPEMYKERLSLLKSNRLVLEIKPSPSAAASEFIGVKNKTAEILQPEKISPDKVVEQTIIARQRTLWDQYFLYLNLEEMLQHDAIQKRSYNAASASDRARMVENYRQELMQGRIDTDIVSVPESFTIERTVYTQTEGMVSVIEWFKYSTYREKKRYTYYVRQRDGIWQIYDYNVDNLGTE